MFVKIWIFFINLLTIFFLQFTNKMPQKPKKLVKYLFQLDYSIVTLIEKLLFDTCISPQNETKEILKFDIVAGAQTL